MTSLLQEFLHHISMHQDIHDFQANEILPVKHIPRKAAILRSGARVLNQIPVSSVFIHPTHQMNGMVVGRVLFREAILSGGIVDLVCWNVKCGNHGNIERRKETRFGIISNDTDRVAILNSNCG